jgi:hypothetical protein
MAKRFSPRLLDVLHKTKILGIRAGTRPHRIIGIWFVMVGDRVFVRSWSMKERSWWRTLLEDPRGVITVGRSRPIPVRAVRTRSETLKDAVSRAYAERYDTPASRRYVRDFARKKRRDTTTELVPL